MPESIEAAGALTPRPAQALGPNPKALVGVWDQWCVMSQEPYVKIVEGEDGKPEPSVSLLDEERCKQITRNFGASKDDLPCTLGHHHSTPDKARWAVCSYSAMVTWSGGRVVEFATHNEAVRAPEISDLPIPDSGGAPDDGNYVYRARVTPLGAAVLKSKSVRKSSPEFVMMGLDQHAAEIGPQAQGLAWTNDPFLTGCEINLERYAGPPLQHICLVPPPPVAKQLVVPGGQPADDMHLTLAVLARPHPAAADIARAAAARTAPLDGKISGPARFAGPDEDVICALVDCPGLGALRQQIVEALAAAGAQVLEDHDFQPHITLAYVPQAETMPARIAPIAVHFADLVVRQGKKLARFSLQGEAMKKKHMMEAGVSDSDTPQAAYDKMRQHYGKKAMMEAGVTDADKPEEAMAKFSKMMEAGDATASSGQMHSEPDADNFMEEMGLPTQVYDAMDPELFDMVRKECEAKAEGGAVDKTDFMECYRKAHMEKHKSAFEYETDPIVMPGAPTRVDEPGQNNKVVTGGGHAMERGRRRGAAATPQRETIESLSAVVQEQGRRLQQYERESASRLKADKRRQATEAVEKAWAAGQIVKHPTETIAQAKTRFVRHFERGEQVFKDALAPVGTQSTREQTNVRLARAGLPVHFERSGVAGGGNFAEDENMRPDEEIIRQAEELRKADPKVNRIAAVRRVCMERPDLETAYRAQAKAALFE